MDLGMEWLDDWMERNRSPYYVLKNGKIKPATVMEWAIWFEDFQNRRVDHTDIRDLPNYPGGEMISTVFLGLDHGMMCEKPVLFETMVFGGKYHQRGWRYSSFGEAKLGHWQIVDCIREGNPPAVNFGERPFMELFLEMFDESESGQPGEREQEEDGDSGESGEMG